MSSRPLILDSLRLLSFICLNPFSSNLINHFYGKCVSVILMGFAVIDVILYLSFNYEGIDSTMEVLMVIGFTQITVKMFFLVERQKELLILINNTSLFWKPKFCDFEQLQENERIFFFVKFCMRSYVGFLLIICLLYYTKPLFLAEGGDLPWRSCFSKIFNFKVCYMIEVIQAPVLVLSGMGFDTLYISLITNLVCEFKLIENRFPNLKINPDVRGTDKEAMDELIELIDHHNLILGCINIMKQIYRTPMLGLFLSNMFGMCFALIILTTGASNSTTKLLYGMVTIFYLVQLFFYCICGSMLADESVKISVQVYKCKWWIKTQQKLRKTLVTVIQRANKPEVLTAGGLLQVNLQTFRMILRSTASFFTFMQVIFGKS